ncbi:MAG: helix-turn-helix transcriptional regulator [Armatimonadetes bacterium]|nr:helix-turn-helix transcriptional regulator [Armatimonadota bacterium]
MIWRGEKIKDLIKGKNITYSKLAHDINVTRPTINAWIKGKIPKGAHILAICKYFNLDPNELFLVNHTDLITIPQHRMRRTAKQTEETNKLSHELVSEYLSIFRNYDKSQLLQIFRDQNLSDDNAKELANSLRKLVSLDDNTPINYKQTFKLLQKLGVFAIFRKFPNEIKSYAFNCDISKKRVIFINNTTNILDLIFPILHEVIHSIKDKANNSQDYSIEEEKFCDKVASYIQFPDSYINLIYANIKNVRNVSQQVNILKQFSSQKGHVGYGVIQRIKEIEPKFKLDISAADINLRKEFETIGEIIFESTDPRIFVNILRLLSPLFVDLLLEQLDILGSRKIGELLDIGNSLDAKSVKDELVMLSKERS